MNESAEYHRPEGCAAHVDGVCLGASLGHGSWLERSELIWQTKLYVVRSWIVSVWDVSACLAINTALDGVSALLDVVLLGLGVLGLGHRFVVRLLGVLASHEFSTDEFCAPDDLSVLFNGVTGKHSGE